MIGVIAPYSQFKEDIEKVAKKLQVDIVVEIGALRIGLKKALKLIQEFGVKVMIARGPTADFFREHLDIPIIKIEVNNFDILKTLNHAKQLNKEVVLIDHVSNKERVDLKTIAHIANVNISLRQYTNERQITKHILEMAKFEGDKTIIGTAECMDITAKSKGMQSFIVFSQSDSLTEGILRAQEALENYLKEEIKQKHLESIISHSQSGIVSTNRQGIVFVCNDVAADSLGISPNEIIGRNLGNIQMPLFKKLLGDFTEVTKRVINHGNQKFLIDRFHLYEQSVVIMFQKTESILQIDTKVRSELYHRRFYAKYSFDDIVFKSNKMSETISLAKSYAGVDSNVLIYGESGTGKELVAQSIHKASERKEGPFIAVNCGAFPENLLESEIFGYEEGAFTGARKGGKPGLFEMAHNGTIFLDEIGEMAMSLQTRLLRVLQEREVRRIGGVKIIPVNVRVVAATNKDLIHSIRQNQFRSDLYYRLNILYIQIPPLRERKEDLDILINRFLLKYQSHPQVISEQQRHQLMQYQWPGNIRELENFIERIIAVPPSLHYQLYDDLLSVQFKEDKEIQSGNQDIETEKNYIKVKINRLEEMEKQIFIKLYDHYGRNKKLLAENLGISRTTLWKKLNQ
ncbi:sigma 54-interacting transcriptional regulator [Alkalihalobacillus pseudalcaliphilus]|uniref:sigma 54-interacting transcriptional regulator n=1 Tax=Alkalihalobacillus pseudalcaliphilus TaxID=79884 RepID=UPI00064DB826|nr:sigma 54-interacting transcriptional regulator [Alkalihalobacillus pseudalcaliphilus]KMK76874.1 hypothetical protein AB990_08250 [Alkalihalobacillus pseudalcaliphilus]